MFSRSAHGKQLCSCLRGLFLNVPSVFPLMNGMANYRLWLWLLFASVRQRNAFIPRDLCCSPDGSESPLLMNDRQGRGPYGACLQAVYRLVCRLLSYSEMVMVMVTAARYVSSAGSSLEAVPRAHHACHLQGRGVLLHSLRLGPGQGSWSERSGT